MDKRFVSIWFRHLVTDWLIRKLPDLKDTPFVIASKERGRMIVTATSPLAEAGGAQPGMAVADIRALLPTVEIFDEKPDIPEKLLNTLADWSFRYTPLVALSLPDGLMLDVTGCCHLWGGETPFLKELVTRLRHYGYDARAAMADTPGAAWAIARYGRVQPIIAPQAQRSALTGLPPAALRLDPETLERMQKLGMRRIGDFIDMPRAVLTRRFGQQVSLRLDQALGEMPEPIHPKRPVDPFCERLAFPEGIATAEGIARALEVLLEKMCVRLDSERKGIRQAVFQGFRVDGIIEEVAIGTSLPARDPAHLFKLFENKLSSIEPALGIELFVLSAPHVENIEARQDGMLEERKGIEDRFVSKLVDRVTNHLGKKSASRYLPQEHYWPERSVKETTSLVTKPSTPWQHNKPRPVRLLQRPEPIDVTAPVPDYPPLMFRYRGSLHRIKKADGPERIEREWWMDKGQPRDYYRVEDEAGQRYWLYRLGHYKDGEQSQWFLHGFFA